MLLFKSLIFITVVFCSGCAWLTADLGIAYDVRADTREYISNNPQAYLKLSVEVIDNVNVDYIHVSSIRTGFPVTKQIEERGTRDMIGISYKFGGK